MKNVWYLDAEKPWYKLFLQEGVNIERLMEKHHFESIVVHILAGMTPILVLAICGDPKLVALSFSISSCRLSSLLLANLVGCYTEIRKKKMLSWYSFLTTQLLWFHVHESSKPSPTVEKRFSHHKIGVTEHLSRILGSFFFCDEWTATPGVQSNLTL